MELLTTRLAETVNQLFLIAIILAALIRLADGLRERLFERISLLAMMTGAFFLLSTNAHQLDGLSGSSVVHPVVVICQYTFLYFKYKYSAPWT